MRKLILALVIATLTISGVAGCRSTGGSSCGCGQ